MRQLTCILIALVIIGVYSDEVDKFMVNGIPTTIEECPHCVSIRLSNYHLCGGSIIDPRYVLTSGFCVAMFLEDLEYMKNVTVVTGTTYLDKGGHVYKIQKMWQHHKFSPEFIQGRSPHDIGLIKLASPIEFGPTQKAIKLPTNDAVEYEAVTIASWSYMGFESKDLRKLNMNVILPRSCSNHHNVPYMTIYKNDICTVVNFRFRMGDFGSGLVRERDGTIIAVATPGWFESNYPDTYTNVYPYRFWIQEKMEE